MSMDLIFAVDDSVSSNTSTFVSFSMNFSPDMVPPAIFDLVSSSQFWLSRDFDITTNSAFVFSPAANLGSPVESVKTRALPNGTLPKFSAHRCTH